MGSPNANVKLREMRGMLKDAGFEPVRQVGSHESWKAPDGAETVVLACHGGEVGERNVSILRKAIARSEARRVEIDAARERHGRMREAAARGADGVEVLQGVEGFENVQSGGDGSPWAVSIQIPDGSPVEIIFVESSGRTRRLLGTPELTRANLFTFIGDHEWKAGTWPSIFETTRSRKRPIGIVVRVWRDDGPEPAIDVFWLDMHDTQRLGNGQMGVGLALVYSGPPVPKPYDVEHNDPPVRLTYDRDTGGSGSWAPGLQYRFRWTALGPRDGLLWHGWATQAEAEAAAEDAWLALAEELAIATTDDSADVLPPEPGDSPAPTTSEPMEPDMPKRERTVVVDRETDLPRPADDVILPFEGRLLALRELLDTPAVRALTGRPVTFDRVLEVVLERGISAIESDLKGNG